MSVARAMERRVCGNPPKIRYSERIDALMALAKLTRQDKPGHVEKRIYQCRLCSGFHLTKQEPDRG